MYVCAMIVCVCARASTRTANGGRGRAARERMHNAYRQNDLSLQPLASDCSNPVVGMIQCTSNYVAFASSMSSATSQKQDNYQRTRALWFIFNFDPVSSEGILACRQPPVKNKIITKELVLLDSYLLLALGPTAF